MLDPLLLGRRFKAAVDGHDVASAALKRKERNSQVQQRRELQHVYALSEVVPAAPVSAAKDAQDSLAASKLAIPAWPTARCMRILFCSPLVLRTINLAAILYSSQVCGSTQITAAKCGTSH